MTFVNERTNPCRTFPTATGPESQPNSKPVATLVCHDSENSWQKRVGRLFCVLLAPALFLSIYVVHFKGGPIPTGFMGHDDAYLVANGRAVFERGNGLAGPNPYDPDPAAPAIYFHWLTWILGFGVSVLGLDPGLLFCGIGLLGSIAFSWFTLRLVERLLPDQRFLYTLFFLTMWGGGLLCLARVVLNLVAGRSPSDDLFAFDPEGGWWIQNWGRNAVYPAEAVYHAIVAATWLAVVCDRRSLVLLGAALLAATHPWSGLQLLLMLGAWYGGLSVLGRGRANLVMALSLAGILALFLMYYFVYLPSFEQHRALQNVWTIAWVLPVSTMILAYGPIGVFAGLRGGSERFRLPDSAWFFATCFLISLLLAKHEWFIKPHQPLHFTRGYLWAPLCFIALPFVQRWLVWCHKRTPSLVFWTLFLLAGGGAVSDNVAFVARMWSWGKIGYTVTPDEARMFADMSHRNLDGVLLCPDPKLSVLTPTYTRIRPYYGHPFNTPNFSTRVEQATAWTKEGKAGPWFDAIDYVLLKKQERSSPLDTEAWEVAVENAEYVLFVRKSGAR